MMRVRANIVSSHAVSTSQYNNNLLTETTYSSEELNHDNVHSRTTLISTKRYHNSKRKKLLPLKRIEKEQIIIKIIKILKLRKIKKQKIQKLLYELN